MTVAFAADHETEHGSQAAKHVDCGSEDLASLHDALNMRSRPGPSLPSDRRNSIFGFLEKQVKQVQQKAFGATDSYSV